MYKIGLSNFCREINEELLFLYQKGGIGELEISLPSDKYPFIDYKKVSKLCKNFGVHINSFHLPFDPFDKLDISKKELAKETVKYLSTLIEKAGDIGIDKMIIHASGEPVGDDERNDRIYQAKESLYTLAETCKKVGAVLAVEDLPRTCLGRNSSDILELISAHPQLKVCFDTNHLLQEDPADFVRKVGDKIVTTHVSDCDFVNERHWLCGEGKINWQAVLQALKDVNYNGVWLYEIGLGLSNTVIRERPLTCDDLVKNANEIFSNKPLTRFSTPKENLGMWG